MSDLLADEILHGRSGAALGAQTPEVRRATLRLIHEHVVAHDSPRFAGYGRHFAIDHLRTAWTRADLEWALDLLLAAGPRETLSDAPFWVPALIAGALDQAELEGLEGRLDAVFGALRDNPRVPPDDRRRLTWIVGAPLRRFAGPDAPAEIHDLFRYASGLSKPVPSRSWLRVADEKLAASPRARDAVTKVLDAHRNPASSAYDYDDSLLRGLIWLQSRTAGDESTALLADVASVVATPVRRGGAEMVTPMAATAIVEVLATRPGDAPVRALARLSLTVRSRLLLPRVRAALDRIGRERGWAPGEALELAVDDHELDRDGRRTWPLGDGAAGMVEVAGGKARLRAYRDGVVLRTVPPAWKDALAEARATVTEINKSLAVERLRVEGLFSQDRFWEWATWVRRYLEHPITGVTARSLIWQASPDGASWTSGIPERTTDGWTLSDMDALPGAGWRVRLWHPATAGTAEVARWRGRVITANLRQPVKQAFREVYPLTPAEEETRIYSNRFAAHILYYRQTAALMRERGWASNYLGPWDGGYCGEAKKELGGGEWQAVFLHDWVESSTWEQVYCATDQVRFGRRDGRAWAPVELSEVPPLVFSEAMRDVDLFVGVTSIAADDAWQDRGEDRFHDYWASASFGELTGRGEMRRDALERLLPRLAIGPRCELRDRFLRVAGTLGAYRIHLGSGNILMEPDDAYLCIVADRGPAKKLSLPFDDDPVLSVILSKAVMLAADDRITDPTITRQLRRSRL
ncbi:DUF4132 domain-containing protein [Actinoplanes sp. TBRC 11911]|uniref:DUF4132 domain-containing protein n=1 Tax=Actinoplanes sp. TBRC 11911 TaxID=2729386 RepID=UPI00145D637F|nr:DUF4132 domain-containing protein [Actinoplanes sp. TBRC 11911]NMO51940.1 DUF4132 domain-containing protein [Actinoplanes sp. TBRC 11911]